ncbi:glycosyltransferase family A protein [Alteromonas sp. C1M14]|uniref:glycosyltransferase family 2 protein n=1 Tax=Alteromonas sp. C1M14 TaxID=2841567 RepID=UPI001C0820C0|nr:glycosyltransferase family A protein [Alteromonas sp. C1M14]MBU2978910.1 glycosyltransferase family 2 protein [Alteromonas sp. C1M14]
MTSQIKIAVIVATKNRHMLLAERSLPSIAHQSKPPDFLIVCDDSDLDIRSLNRNSIQDIEIPNCSVTYRVNTRTHGASGCWNSAVKYLASQVDAAENVMLAFLDDDDSWHPSYLEECVKAVQSYELDMVASGLNRIESNCQCPIQILAPARLEAQLFLTGNPGIQGSNLFLRMSTFLQSGGFDEFLASSTDRDLCIRLSELGTLRYQALPRFLVDHYAETNRIRLSNSGGKSKLNGLSSFWKKYQSRMNTLEAASFKQRAHELFAWKPPTNKVSENCCPDNKAIVLCCSTSVTRELLNKIVAFFHFFRTSDLVGLDVVFHIEPNNRFYENLANTLRNLGLGCFPVKEFELLESYAVNVSELRPGSTIWVIDSLAESHLELFNDSESYLTCNGAKMVNPAKCPETMLSRGELEKLKEEVYAHRLVSAEHRVNHHFNTKDLRLLGSGSEAIVFTDDTIVYKCIDYWKTRTPEAQFEFLRDCGAKWRNIPGIYPLKHVIRDGAWVLLTYPFEESSPYNGGFEKRLIELINGCTRAGIVCNNIHPKNLITTETEVKLIDYGSDIRPWNELGFEHMARRAYLSCHHAHRDDLKQLMRKSLTHLAMPELAGFETFRAKLDYPINRCQLVETTLEKAPNHQAFKLVVGVISTDPLTLMPLLNSLRVLHDHPSITSLSVFVLCNGCTVTDFIKLRDESFGDLLTVNFISEEVQLADAKSGLFGSKIQSRPSGQVGIAFARTMLQRYIGGELVKTSGTIGWLLDDDMRIDERARKYIGWLPAFREQRIDVLFGAYEGSSPNPPLNGLRVQLMDLVHNAAWLAKLPDDALLPDRTEKNKAIRNTFPDYYYDLSRKHSTHLETPLWLEPSYPFETVKEAKNRLFAGALGILDGTPLTRSIIAAPCRNPINEAKDSVNRGGCTFILNPQALLKTPNLSALLNGKEVRRSDMIWAIINKHYQRMTLKSVAFPVHHVGRSYSKKTINSEKVQCEIVGSALYAGLVEFLGENSEHRMKFSTDEVADIYSRSMNHMDTRILLLEQSFYRISGLAKAIKNGPFYKELKALTDCLEQEFALKAFEKIKLEIKNVDKNEISRFLKQMTSLSDAYATSINQGKTCKSQSSKICESNEV